MAFQEAKRTLHTPKIVCNEFEERSVDVDIVLADYCADVTTILKCFMRPVVTSCFRSGDRYTVDGVTDLRILYLSEDRTAVHCYEATQPFNISFRCDDALHHQVKIKSDYVNCRAISPRRMDIHGAFRVYLTAVGEGEMTVFADPERRDVFCKTRTICETIPVCESNKPFLIDESIDLGISADRLLYTDVTVASSECKSLTNKMIVKGVLSVKSVFCVNTQTQCSLEEIPFSQIVDIDGLNDQWDCNMHISVGETEASLQQLDNGGSRINITAKLNAHILCNRTESTDVVIDAYCSTYPLICETMPLQAGGSNAQHSRLSLKQTMSLSDSMDSVEDMWGELKACELKNGIVSCCILIGAIGRDGEGIVNCLEKTLDFEVTRECDADDVFARLINVNYHVNGDQLYVQPEVELCMIKKTQDVVSVVSDIVEDTKQPYPKTSSAIRIVYVSAGESLWEIAKKHRADVHEIMAENDLQDSVLTSPTMLMIPML